MVSEEETVTTKSRFYRDLLSFSLLRPHLFVTGCNFRKRISAWRQYRYSGDRVNGCLTNTGKMAIKKGPRPPSLLFRLGGSVFGAIQVHVHLRERNADIVGIQRALEVFHQIEVHVPVFRVGGQERVTKFREDGAISFRRTVTPLACMMRLSAAITSPSTFFTTSISAL